MDIADRGPTRRLPIVTLPDSGAKWSNSMRTLIGCGGAAREIPLRPVNWLLSWRAAARQTSEKSQERHNTKPVVGAQGPLLAMGRKVPQDDVAARVWIDDP
jgi:hypothetical protein